MQEFSVRNPQMVSNQIGHSVASAVRNVDNTTCQHCCRPSTITWSLTYDRNIVLNSSTLTVLVEIDLRSGNCRPCAATYRRRTAPATECPPTRAASFPRASARPDEPPAPRCERDGSVCMDGERTVNDTLCNRILPGIAGQIGTLANRVPRALAQIRVRALPPYFRDSPPHWHRFAAFHSVHTNVCAKPIMQSALHCSGAFHCVLDGFDCVPIRCHINGIQTS